MLRNLWPSSECVPGTAVLETLPESDVRWAPGRLSRQKHTDSYTIICQAVVIRVWAANKSSQELQSKILQYDADTQKFMKNGHSKYAGSVAKSICGFVLAIMVSWMIFLPLSIQTPWKMNVPPVDSQAIASVKITVTALIEGSGGIFMVTDYEATGMHSSWHTGS